MDRGGRQRGGKLIERACRNCRMIVEEDVCPKCKSSSLSNDWVGYVVIVNPENSMIAKRLNITSAGKYALKVR